MKISVIISAYNAAATIGDTLASVRAQTHRDLEILVVDDGSTDATASIIRRHAAEDGRIRLIEQTQDGVAAARNAGIAQAQSDLIAPIDADDLWRPHKLERQLATMEAGGDRLGLVYSWFAVIDQAGRILSETNSASEEGDVLRRMCMGNLVGNGSSPLMRRAAVEMAGGYDPGLRAQHAQGCEDLKLYFAIAERYHFGLVREHLTGYRWSPANMSADGSQMLRSYDLVMNANALRYPQFADEFHLGRGYMIKWLAKRALLAGSLRSVVSMMAELVAHDPLVAARFSGRASYFLALRATGRATTGKRRF